MRTRMSAWRDRGRELVWAVNLTGAFWVGMLVGLLTLRYTGHPSMWGWSVPRIWAITATLAASTFPLWWAGATIRGFHVRRQRPAPSP